MTHVTSPSRDSGLRPRAQSQSEPIYDLAEGYRDSGRGWTVAFQHDFNPHLSLALEFIEVDSRLNERLEFGLPDAANERELELALRLQL